MGNQKRKCIAVIISKPERKYQEGLLEGICKSAFAKGMNVAVFATSLINGMVEYQWGEEQIYDLINYDRFVGVVYACGSFYGNEFTQTLNQCLKEVAARGIPVVCVDEQVEGLPCYFNDDSNAIEDIIDHLTEEHGVEDIAYMTGHQGHPHAENALAAYRRAMDKHGLPVFEDRTYYGDYWYTKAEDFILQLENSPRGLPQAIVCANEFMAIGVYRVLHQRGVYIPKHILLACTANDAITVPYLLVGENNLENVGYEACEKIFRVIDGEAAGEETIFFPSKNVLRTSVGCGCQKASAYDYSKERGILIDTEAGYFGELNFHREGMLSTKSFRALFEVFDEHTEFVKGFRELYMCMCEGWDSPNFQIGGTTKNPYTERMQLYYSRKETPQGPEVCIDDKIYFPKEEMIPGLFDDTKEPSVYVFRALHFLDRNFGYIVLNNGQNTKVYDYTMNFWLHDLSNALEAQCRLQSVNYMFYTDIMTGLYNRNGFNIMLTGVLEEAKRHDKQVLVALADLNFLKKINDTYGHKEGDVAIKAGARLLSQTKIGSDSQEKNFRIGGDEFVKIAIGEFTDEQMEQFKERLYQAAVAHSDSTDKPYNIEMSLGYCYERVSTMEEMEALLSKADKNMYQEKKRLKGFRQV